MFVSFEDLSHWTVLSTSHMQTAVLWSDGENVWPSHEIQCNRRRPETTHNLFPKNPPTMSSAQTTAVCMHMLHSSCPACVVSIILWMINDICFIPPSAALGAARATHVLEGKQCKEHCPNAATWQWPVLVASWLLQKARAKDDCRGCGRNEWVDGHTMDWWVWWPTNPTQEQGGWKGRWGVSLHDISARHGDKVNGWDSKAYQPDPAKKTWLFCWKTSSFL